MENILTRFSRLFFGLLGFSALVTEIAVLAERGLFDAPNFFSYFTILSNIAVAGFLLFVSVASDAVWKKRSTQYIRGAITLYIGMTGIIFAVLLSGMQSLTATPWDNIVLHYIIPVVMLADWLVYPPKVKLSYKVIAVWAIIPIAYVVYSLVRGSVINWYPYPFLNASTHGYDGVIITTVFLAVFVILLAFAMIWYGRWRSKSIQ